jgi:ABC-2 family transporter protein
LRTWPTANPPSHTRSEPWGEFVTWVIWRQHRNQAFVAVLAICGLVALLAITGVHMAATYHSALRTCAATGGCDSVADGLFNGDGAIIDLVNATAVVPLLIGLFWGAPLLAREFEFGTQRLMWTQSVTRRRWLASKTIALMAAAIVVSGVTAVAVTWWSRTFDLSEHNRFDKFDIEGFVPVAYAIFAAALGLAAGIVIRRTLPAIITALVGFTGIRLIVAIYVRPHLMTAVSDDLAVTAPGTGLSGSNWILSNHYNDAAGRPVSNDGILSAMPASCRQFIGTTRAQILSCVGDHGWYRTLTYQPANRFWTFQGIEAALFVALAIVLIAVSTLSVRHDA